MTLDTSPPPPAAELHFMLVDKYVYERYANDELSIASVDAIRRRLRQWCAFVEFSPPDRWTSDDVLRWLGRGLKPATRKSYKTTLRPYMVWLSERSLIDPGAIPRFPTSRSSDREPRDLTSDQVRRLIAACPDERGRLIVLLMVHLGLRCGDVANILVEDIDTASRRLHVRAKGGRGDFTHWDPIPSEAWTALTAWLERTRLTAGTGPLVFTGGAERKPMTANWISKLLCGWMRDAGIKRAAYDGVSGHALRHTAAQHMYDRGADLREIQHALGHQSIRSTEIYVRREPPNLRQAMDGRRYLPGTPPPTQA